MYTDVLVFLKKLYVLLITFNKCFRKSRETIGLNSIVMHDLRLKLLMKRETKTCADNAKLI